MADGNILSGYRGLFKRHGSANIRDTPRSTGGDPETDQESE